MDDLEHGTFDELASSSILTFDIIAPLWSVTCRPSLFFKAERAVPENHPGIAQIEPICLRRAGWIGCSKDQRRKKTCLSELAVSFLFIYLFFL